MRSPITTARAAPPLACPEPPTRQVARRLSEAQPCSATPLAWATNAEMAEGCHASECEKSSRADGSRPKGALDQICTQLPKFAFAAGRSLFRQGETADALFYISHGRLHRTITTKTGDERLVAILGLGDFCGEECLTPKPYHRTSAIVVQDAEIIKIDGKSVSRLLQGSPDFADALTKFLATHSLETEVALIDQLVGSVEQRLRRALLRLAHIGNEEGQLGSVLDVNQEMLAQLVGTTRQRVNYFLNKFRRLGLIDYTRSGPRVIQVRGDLQQVEEKD
jgi:CRP/FNR family transcriptional regulator, cyclic AMP receptor protein